jgi:hypothetical protein
MVHSFQDQPLGESVDSFFRGGYGLFEYDFHSIVAVYYEFDITFDIILDHENLAKCPSAEASNNFEVSDSFSFFVRLWVLLLFF